MRENIVQFVCMYHLLSWWYDYKKRGMGRAFVFDFSLPWRSQFAKIVLCEWGWKPVFEGILLQNDAGWEERAYWGWAQRGNLQATVFENFTVQLFEISFFWKKSSNFHRFLWHTFRLKCFPYHISRFIRPLLHFFACRLPTFPCDVSEPGFLLIDLFRHMTFDQSCVFIMLARTWSRLYANDDDDDELCYRWI